MRKLYTLLLYLLLPLVFARLWWRGRKLPAYRERWTERLGFVPDGGQRRVVWIHAVSVGETIAAAPLVRRLQALRPDLPLLVTTTTPTGSAQVRKLFGEHVQHSYFPYDLPGAVARFLRRTRPCLLLVMETELWPNTFHACRLRGIPVIIANARLSERSARGYRRFQALSEEALSDVTAIAAQSEADAERFRALGAGEERVRVLGNLKFDIKPSTEQVDAGRALRERIGPQRPVWIAGSTHAGEEALLLEAHGALRRTHPDLLLILVPRHPERFDAVAGLCLATGLPCARRSGSELPNATTAVYLGDTLGELTLLYAAADIAFVGGSFSATGGHNPLEPAALSIPVITGPSTFNFSNVYEQLLAAQAARRVADVAELTALIEHWLDNPEELRTVGRNARAVVNANRGSLDRLLTLVAEHLPTA